MPGPEALGLGPLEVRLEDCEGSFERMLRRFVRQSRDEGTLAEVSRRSRGFVKPSQARRRKKIASR